MAFSLAYVVAPVVYEYVWSVDETPKQTSTYTTTYFTYPGTHTAYALIANTALPPPRDIEVVGIPYRIVPGETSTQHVSATVATHSPIAPTWKTNHASITSTTDSSVRATTGPKLPHQEVVHAGAHSPHTSYFTYLQIVLVCLFCGGFLWSRCRRHIRSRSSRPQDRRGTFATFEKSAVKEAV
jgi:hypothetical protein